MTTRKQILKAIILKRQGFFSLDQIIEQTHYPRPVVKGILTAFVAEGSIKETKRSGTVGRPGIYRVNQSEEGEGIALNRMWTTIRYKGTFELSDLIKLANVKRETARSFIKTFRKGGFISPSKPTGRGVFWTLIKDVGPRRPYIGDQIKKR
jgi:DNA-binding IclR family transcriptional regulator